MTVVPANAFGGVLKAGRHERLALDIDKYAQRAGIDPTYIWTSASEMLKPQTIEYLKRCLRIAKTGTPGAAFETGTDVTRQMSMMAGALIRAFVDARVMSVAQVVEEAQEGGPEATVLLVPNFFSHHEYGKFDERKIAALGDVMSDRLAHGLPTVVRIDSHQAATARMGQRIGSILEQYLGLEA